MLTELTSDTSHKSVLQRCTAALPLQCHVCHCRLSSGRTALRESRSRGASCLEHTTCASAASWTLSNTVSTPPSHAPDPAAPVSCCNPDDCPAVNRADEAPAAVKSGPLLKLAACAGSGPAVNCGGDPPAAVNSGALPKARLARPDAGGPCEAALAANGAGWAAAAVKPADCAVDANAWVVSMQAACQTRCSELSTTASLVAGLCSSCASRLSMMHSRDH